MEQLTEAASNLIAWAKRNPLLAGYLALGALITAAGIVLLAQENLDGEGAAAILALLLICAFLAAGGAQIVQRISKIGPLELSASSSVVPRLISRPAASGRGMISEEYASPWTRIEPTAEDKWWFEENMMILTLLKHQGHLNEAAILANRNDIFALGVTAANMGDYPKARSCLQFLEQLNPRSAQEDLYIGASYLWMAVEDYIDPQEHDRLIENARIFLEEAARLDATNPLTLWTLGYVYDELSRYAASIDANTKAAANDPRYVLWADWTIAVSQTKLTKWVEALEALKAIPASRWWDEIYEDPELKPLREHAELSSDFWQLYQERRLASEAQ